MGNDELHICLDFRCYFFLKFSERSIYSGYVSLSLKGNDCYSLALLGGTWSRYSFEEMKLIIFIVKSQKILGLHLNWTPVCRQSKFTKRVLSLWASLPPGRFRMYVKIHNLNSFKFSRYYCKKCNTVQRQSQINANRQICIN